MNERPRSDDALLVTNVMISPTLNVFAAVALVSAGVLVTLTADSPVTAVPLILIAAVIVPEVVCAASKVLIVPLKADFAHR